MRNEKTFRAALRRLLPAFAGCAAVLLLIPHSALRTPHSHAQEALPAEAPEDPFPIRRVLLPPERLPAELERVKQGVLVRRPREEFEALVRDAARAAASGRKPPRLIAAAYRARLTDGGGEPGSAAGLAGTAEWKVVNPGEAAGLLPLGAMELALRDARWTDNRPALVGALDAANPAAQMLLVERPGESQLGLEWSARAMPEPGELRFDLRVPACAVATLDLEIPGDLTPQLPSADTLLTPLPDPADRPGWKAWRVSFGGLGQVDLSLLRRPGPDQPGAPVRARLAARQEVAPGVVRCKFDFALEVGRGGVTELTLEHDPALRPTDVVVNNLESWKPLPAEPGRPPRLQVRLREPSPGGKLEVYATAPLPPDGTWGCPGMRVVGGLSRGESLEVRVAPDLELADWRPGGFRLVRSEAEADRTYVLSLRSGLVAGGPGESPARPQARFRPRGTEYQVRQQTEWHLRADGATLTARLSYDVARGALFRLPLRVPPGWEVDQVDLTPRDCQPEASLQPGPSPTLTVSLRRPLTPGVANQLTVQLRGPAPPPRPAGRPGRPAPWLALPFPDVAPAALPGGKPPPRDGTFAIRVSPAFEASATPPQAPAPPAEGVAPSAAGEWLYPFRGIPPEGALHLRARPARLAARCDSVVTLAGGRPRVVARLRLTPESGAAASVLLYASAPAAGPWGWHVVEGPNRLLSADPVPAVGVTPFLSGLSAAGPLDLFPRLAAPPDPAGRWWRLTFARPLQEPVTLEATCELSPRPRPDRAAALVLGGGGLSTSLPAPPADGEPVRVPLVAVVGAEQTAGKVTLNLPAGGWAPVASGLVAEPVAPGRGARPTFRYGTGAASLALVRRPAAGTGSAQTDGAILTTCVDVRGGLRCHFRFRLRGWTGGGFAVRLPAGAELLAVAVAGTAPDPADRRVRADAEGVVCSFPVPGGDAWNTVELVYDLPAPGGRLAPRVESPAPGLPVEPPGVRRLWWLAPGLAPLRPGDLAPLPGGEAEREWFALPAGVLRALGRSPETSEDRLPPAFLGLAALPGSPRPATFGDGLLRLATLPAANAPLVLDLDALAEAGVGPGTPLPTSESAPAAPFWEAPGLTAVPCRGAALLTTPRQLSQWRTAGDGDLPDAVVAACAAAAGRGRDPSGRFWLAADWLESQPPDAPAPRRDALRAMLPDVSRPGWAGWEPGGEAVPAGLTLVRSDTLALLGWCLAALLLGVAGACAGGESRAGRVLLAAWLAVSAVAFVWLPALRPLTVKLLLAALLAAAVAALLRRRAPRPAEAPTAVTRRSSLRSLVPAVGVLAALALAALAVRAADAPPPPAVYLLPAANGEVTAVLAPPDLLARLRALAGRPLPLPDALVVAVRYEGRVEEGVARFAAQVRAHSFVDGPADLVVPLGGARLRGGMLDGAPAFPRPAGAGRYAFSVKGKGPHALSLEFEVPLAGTGADRELKFAGPEVPQARLTFDAPKSARQLHATNWRGAQGTEAQPNGVRLWADLGRARSVHLRWRETSSASARPRVQVQEASLWDIDPASAGLRAVFTYRVTRGSVSQFRIAVPAGLEVARLDVRPLDPSPGVTPSAWLKDWHLGSPGGPSRALRLDLQAPVTGRARVTLELVPARPPVAAPGPPAEAALGTGAAPGWFRLDLTFPHAADADEAEGFVAVRAQGLELPPDFPRRGVADASAEAFFKEVWRPVNPGGAGLPPTRAFRRKPNAVASLSPVVLPPAPPARGHQELTWWVGPRGAEVQGKARWSAAGAELSFVEWEVPAGVSVAEVRGAGLFAWARSGTRVQAWLEKPAGEVALDWCGLLARPAGPAQEEFAFYLPRVVLAGVASQTAAVRVRPLEGWTLTPERTPGLRPAEAGAVRQAAFQADGPNYHGRFLLRGPQPDAAFALLSFAEVVDGRFVLRASLEAKLRRDRPHTFTVVLRQMANAEVELSAPDCRVTPRSPGELAAGGSGAAGGRAWTIDVPPRPSGETVRVTVTCRLPLAGAAELRLPEVGVWQGELPPARLVHWVVLAGRELALREEVGLQPWPAENWSAALRPWPGKADRLRRAGGSVWRAEGDVWRLRATAVPTRLPGGVPVQVALAEVEAASDGPLWVYRTAYELFHEADAELAVALPPGARPEGLAVDALPARVQVDGGRVRVPLPREAGVRVVQIVWSRPAAPEDALPPIDLPRLESGGEVVPQPPALWTVCLPPGLRPSRGVAGAAVRDLRRAEAELRLARLLAERQLPDGAAGPAGRCARRLRLAEARLAGASAPAGPADLGPEGLPPAEWLSRLRGQLAAVRPAAAASASGGVRERGAGRLPFAAAFERGTPTRWQAPEQAPEVRPVSSGLAVAARLGTTTLLLLLVGGYALLAGVAGGITRPEQVALVGALGTLAFGLPAGAAFLLLPALALLVRTGWLVWRGVRWLRPRLRPQPVG